MGVRRCGIEPVLGRLPREARARTTELTRRLACRRQPPDSVLEHRARRSWVGRGKERQDEHVAVPEHVAAISVARQATGSNCCLALVAYRRDQVIEGKPNAAL